MEAVGGLEIQQLSSDTFLFSFDNEPDCHWASFEPWHFDRALLVLNDVIILPHPNVGSDSLASIV